MNSNLINTLSNIPEGWALTPVKDKKPMIDEWEKGFSLTQVIEYLKNGYDGISKKDNKPYHINFNGIGLITGELSGCIVAIDCDGVSAHQKAEKLGGLPTTVSFTSGKFGRAQHLYIIEEEYREAVKGFTRIVIPTGVEGEQLEIRFNGCQSVLPPSKHPETGHYKWINDLNTPIALAPLWIIEQMLGEESSEPDSLPLTYSNDEPIPLYNCLSLEVRHLIDSGVSQGGRNDGGAKVARDLLGTEARLHYLGICYTDSARSLFDAYCDRCSPAISPRERETIWKSALKDNPTATLDDDKLENCWKAWQKKQKQSSINTSKSNSYVSGTAALKPEPKSNVIPINKYQQPQLDIESLENDLRKLAEQNLDRSKLRLQLNALAKKHNLNPKEVQDTFKEIQDEDEQQANIGDIKIELDEFLKNKNQSLDLSKYLPGKLSIISEFASRLCLRPEVALTAFLSVVSSLQHVKNKIDLLAYTDFDQPLILFNAICAEPSQKKSPLINKIATEPLRELQEMERKRYEVEMKNYKIDHANWENLKDKTIPEPEQPVMRRYYINDKTQAGLRNLLNIQSKHNWGLLILCDELAGNFKNQSKTYNAGMVEDLLSYYDGFGKIEALKDGFAGDFDKCLISILGGIQPEVMREFNNGSDSNGQWARFNYLNQPTTPFIIPDNPPAKLDIRNFLVDFYSKIANLPQLNLRLSTVAESYFAKLNNKCELYRVEAKSSALAAQWGKMPGKIGRFAALLHIINEVWQHGTVVDMTINATTVKLAAELSKFYFNEAQNLYGTCSEGELAPQLAKILDLAEKRKEPIAARDVSRSNRDFRGLKPEEVRSMFIQLVELGYGSIIGSGSNIKFSKNLSPLSPVVASSGDTSKGIYDRASSHLSPLSPGKNKNSQGNQQLGEINQSDYQPPHLDEPQDIKNEEKTSTETTNGCNPDRVIVTPFTESTQPLAEENISKTVATVATNPQNIDIEEVLPCHQTGDKVATVATNSNERSPEPEPEPLVGAVYLDPQGYPHKIIKKINNEEWLTQKKAIVTRAIFKTYKLWSREERESLMKAVEDAAMKFELGETTAIDGLHSDPIKKAQMNMAYKPIQKRIGEAKWQAIKDYLSQIAVTQS